MSKRMLILMCTIFLVVPVIFMGCGETGATGAAGANGAAGAPGAPGANGINGTDLTATAEPESCVICHKVAGADHQASFAQLYQDTVIVASNLTYTFDAASGNDVVTFKLTKAGLPLSGKVVQNLNIYFTGYDSATRKFNVPGNARLSIKGTVTYDAGTYITTSTKASVDNVSLLTKNGLVIVYGYDESSGSAYTSGRVKLAKYNYSAVLPTGAGVDYVSAANVAGCEKCHMKNYVKHGNIPGRVSRTDNTQFYTCKACHLDDAPGSDFVWQLLVDDPVAAVAIENGDDYTPAQETKYAYKTKLMNDVHMSHAMEFEYPQSMYTCATCHEGKLNVILQDKYFVVETCKSCHPVTGSAQAEKAQPSLQQIWADKGVGFHNAAMTCNIVGCHTAGGSGKTFGEIHTGYDKKIYTSSGTRYSSAFTVTIDNASFVDNTNILTFGFHATGSLPGLAVTDIKPTVLVGLYGWDSKDYIVGPHLNYTDGKRNLEYVVGATHPRFTTVSAAGGSWTVTADLSAWAAKIADGSVKRAEIAVMPTLRSAAIADNQVLALNAPSRTFVLASKVLQPPVSDSAGIVKVAGGCNNCHDALGTSFHSGDRGGNIVVCRLCHTTATGSSHLEMQSRSIDSYAHAIHAFQELDIQNIDFADPVKAMFYNLKVESNFPTFGINDCEACHNQGKYNVPDQSKSLPGVLSASRDTLIGWNRKIDSVQSYVVGPASRACGSCHRAEWIKTDDAVMLASFNSHTSKPNGYFYAGGATVIDEVINKIMSYWEDGIVLAGP